MASDQASGATTKARTKTKANDDAANDGHAAAVRKAFAANDGSAALVAALEWWRASPSPASADLVDAISTQITGPAIDDESEWATVAKQKDPVDVGRLIAGVPALPVRFLPPAATLLAGFPNDPRIAKAVATWALDPVTTSSSTYPFWAKLLDRAGEIGDVRVIPLLRERLAKPKGGSQFWPKFYVALERLLTKVETVPTPAVDERALAELAGDVARLAKAKPRSAPAAAPREDVVEAEGTPLVQARTHLEAGRIGAAIEAMLVAWRESRAPAIADVIDRATRLLPIWDKPFGMNAKEVDGAWMKAVREEPARTMPQLLQNVNVGGSSAAEQHVLELATLPDDPRMAMRLTALTRHSTSMSPQRTQYWKSLLEIIARARDVRTCGPLRKQFREFRDGRWDHHRQARRIVGDFALDPSLVFPSWPLEVGSRERAELTALEGSLAKVEAKENAAEHELLGAIAESWNDDGPRLVYADWLSERGHPRGELIVLACKQKPTASEKKRLKDLSNAPYIHGALMDVGRLTIDRGVPHSVVVSGSTSSILWSAVTGSPAAALLERITFDHESNDGIEDIARFALHPSMRRLQRIETECNDTSTIDALEPLVKERFRRDGRKSLVRA